MLKKKIWLLIFIIFCSLNLPSYAKVTKKTTKKTTKTTVKTVKPAQTGYTVPTAKAEAFKDVKNYLPVMHFKSDLTDRDYAANVSYMNKQLNTSADGSRILFPLYIGDTLISYGIRYTDKPDKVYYYNSKGNLLRIEYDNNNPPTYPKRTLTYNSKGNLNSVVLYISDREQYNFDGKGNLVVHWIGERGFNRMGQPIRIRRSL